MRTSMVHTREQAQMKQLLNTPIDRINKVLAERSLAEFVKQLWPYIDPHPYVHGWHIDAICEHMEAVVNGDIKRILINIPPRHMKSISISVGLCPWAWLKKPSLQFLYSSYASGLSIRDGVKARRVIDSPMYKSRWGEKFTLTSDQNTKIRFDNKEGGYRISTSVDGMTTGEGGDIIVIDDPNNVKEAESDVKRNSTNEWFDEVMQSRFNDPKTGALVVIQQRTNAQDLSGHILKKYGTDEYYHLILPAEYEPKTRSISWGGWVDPRTEEGELLWPERFGVPEVERLKLSLGVYAAAGQLQQRPSPRDGGIIPIKSFQRYTRRPELEQISRLSLVFDTAQKDKELNDYSVCQVWAETSWGYYLLFVWRKKVLFPELERMAIALCEEWCPHEVIIEDKSSGTSLIQCLKERTNFPIFGEDPGSQSKILRMENESTLIESGKVYIPDANDNPPPWLADFEDECLVFPNGEHDDQIDPMSMYLKRVRLRRQRGPVNVAPLIDDNLEKVCEFANC
jgi:predicted phage terminase large subunit-like protein